MANKYTFSERYKKELVDIEIKFSDEEKNYYEDLLKYDESVFVGILGTERYQKTLEKIQENIKNDNTEIEEYKRNEIYNYIRTTLYGYLDKNDFLDKKEKQDKDFFSDDKERQAEFYEKLLYFALDNNKQKWTDLFEQFLEYNASRTQIKLQTTKRKEECNFFHEFLKDLIEYGVLNSSLLEDRKTTVETLWKMIKGIKEKDLWNMRKFIRINSLNEKSWTIQRSRYFWTELLERDVLFELVDNWRIYAEKKGKNSRIRERKILLCQSNDTKEINEIKKSFMEELKDRYQNWKMCNAMDFYFNFLCKYIFPEIDFWKIVLNNKSRKQRYFDNKLMRGIQGVLGAYEGDLWTHNETERIENSILMTDIEEEWVQRMVWSFPKKAEELFSENFMRYSFQRGFGALHKKYFGGTGEMQRLFEVSSSYKPSYEKFADWKYGIHRSVSNWISICYEDFYLSTSKDVLFCILNGTTIPKRERKTVEYDPINGYHLCGDRDKTFIWTRDEPKEKDKSYSMEKFFSLEYQLLSKRQGTKIKKPQFLIDRALEDNNEVEYFERYVLEMQHGIFTAWRLYCIVYELFVFDDQYKDLKEATSKLSKSIGKIHNLELRLHVLNEIEIIIHAVKDNRYLELVKSVEQIAEIVDEEAQEFNEMYDRVFLGLLWMFKDEKNWKEILWLRNIENIEFSKILSEIKDLQRADFVISYTYLKFCTIYKEQKVAKGRKYDIYNAILEALKEKESLYEKLLNS